MTKEDENTYVEIGTIYGKYTKQGLIEFKLTHKGIEHKAQWDIAKAKEIRNMLGEAIEAAITDTLIVKFMTEKVGLDETRAAMMLHDFRELRQGTKGVLFPF